MGTNTNTLISAAILTGWPAPPAGAQQMTGTPGTAAWTLGLLFGINLFMWGMSLVMTAIGCRAVARAPHATKAAV